MAFLKSVCLVFVLLVVLKLDFLNAEFKRVCYYTNWAPYRTSGGEFYPENIDPFLCSHIIYAFAKIENNTIVSTKDNDMEIDGGPGMYTRIMALKIFNPSLKILLAIGGWDQGSYPFDLVLKNDQSLQTFVENTVQFLRKWEFDGLDVDWEFPIVNKKGFTRLLESLRLSFDMDSIIQGKPLLLTCAVSASQATVDNSYEVNNIAELVDFVNLMAYDFHGSWEIKTGYHSALYAGEKEKFWEKTLNANWSVNYWLNKGMPKEKIVLGLALYGRGYKLSNSLMNKVGAPTLGASSAGNYTNEAGALAFFEICEIIRKNELKPVFDFTQKVSHIQFGSNWIGYENRESLLLKADYIKDNCLGGFMVWTIDFDDFTGKFCCQGAYPLLHLLNDALNNSACFESTKPPLVPVDEITTQPEYTTLAPVETTTEKTTTTTTTTTSTTKTTTTTTKTTTKTTTTTSTTTKTTTLRTTSQSTTDQAEQVDGEDGENDLDGFTPIPITDEITDEPDSTVQSSKTVVSTILTSKIPTKTSPLTTKPTTTFPKPTITTQKPTITTTRVQAPLGICLSSEYIRSNRSCRHYDVCLKGFRTPMATLECPDSYWFDWTAQTCVNKKPLDCKTDPSTTVTGFQCPEKSGIFADPLDCKRFWHCSNGLTYHKTCPGNLVFNDVIKNCDYSSKQCPKYKYIRQIMPS